MQTSDKTLWEIKIAKKQMENDIQKAITKFMNETGVKLTGLEVLSKDLGNGSKQILKVVVSTEID